MNMCTGSALESKDLLFQTLNTTQKRFRLPSGQLGLMLDTVGFITNLPHGLVESFKTTLEEIHGAEILVHVRDISNPHSNFQRDTVLKVLKEIGVPEESLRNRYLEVWNKIDLVGTDQLDQLKHELATTAPTYPVIMMSCKNGTNREVFMDQIQSISAAIMGKKPMTLRYRYQDHTKVTKWLLEHTNLSSGSVESTMEYGDDGYITVQAPIDEIIYQKYLKQFEPERFED
jgi:50S ribosomal subunit-associated GTPase HflX